MHEGNPVAGAGEQGGSQPRSLIVFCDLVGSTELSGRHEPERYALLVRRYLSEIHQAVEHFGGEVIGEEGDGVLALFGAPNARGDDAERAVRTGLRIVDQIGLLSAQTEQEIGERLAVRVAIHRGQIFRATDGAVYGLATNVAARLQTLAGPNEVVVSDEVQRLVGKLFETEAGEPQHVKGVTDPLRAHRVLRVLDPSEIAPKELRPLINRRREWGQLNAAWTTTRGGGTEQAKVVLLRGDPGVGKSYLASMIASVAGEEGAPVVELAGSAFFEEAGLYPVRRFMEKTSGYRRDTDGVDRLALLRTDLDRRGLSPDVFVPRLAPILGLEPETGYQPEELDARKLGEEIQEAAYTYVESCLGDDPSVVVAEDVQWFDDATHNLLSRLTSTRSDCAVIMTARPGYLPFNGVETIDLEPMSDRDCGALIDAICTEAPIDEEVRLDVIARSDGIPLYVEELVANVRQGATSVGESAAADRPSGTVPDLLYDLLAARLASPPEAIPVASASAVIGRDVDRWLLERVIDLPPSELEQALTVLCAQGVLELVNPTEGQYRFRHELLREVAYELQAPSQRRAVHGRAADALVSSAVRDGSLDWAPIAMHYEEAERALDAVDAYEKAAAGARMRGALTEARVHLGKAIELLLSRIGHDVERDTREVNLRLQRGYVASAQEGFTSTVAEEEYERCLELTAADPLSDPTFNTVVVLWSYHYLRGRLSKAREISEFTYRNLDKREWYRNFNIAAFGLIDCWEGDLSTARDRLEMFYANRNEEDEERFAAQWFYPIDPTSSIFSTLSVVRFLMGELAGATAIFEETMERTGTISFPQGPFTAVYALTIEAWLRMELLQFDTAEERLDQNSELMARHGLDDWGVVDAMQRSVLAGLRAMHSGAEGVGIARYAGEVTAMTEIWKQFDVKFFLPYYLMIAGVLHEAVGDAETAGTVLADSLSMAEETGMKCWKAETLRHLANLEPDVAKRRTGLRSALQQARVQHAYLFELRAALDIATVDGPGGRALLEAALENLGKEASYPEVDRALVLIEAQR
jgi:class 3 adenylate cyclase